MSEKRYLIGNASATQWFFGFSIQYGANDGGENLLAVWTESPHLAQAFETKEQAYRIKNHYPIFANHGVYRYKFEIVTTAPPEDLHAVECKGTGSPVGPYCDECADQMA